MSKPSTSFTAAQAYLLTSKANANSFLAIIKEAQDNPRISFLKSGAIDWAKAIRDVRKIVSAVSNTYEERVFIALLSKLSMHWGTCSCGALPANPLIKRDARDGKVQDDLLHSYGVSFGLSFTRALEFLKDGDRIKADVHLRNAESYRKNVKARFDDIIKTPDATEALGEEKELRYWNEFLDELNDFVGKPDAKPKPAPKKK